MPLLKGDAVGMLELRDVRLELGGKAVLSGLSVDFWQGHIHALVGLNGLLKFVAPKLRFSRAELLLIYVMIGASSDPEYS